MTTGRSDLDWLAFQYIAGELSVDDAAQFESRLAIDQMAREAVAAAVELSEVAAIAECRPVELAHAQATHSQSTHWQSSLSRRALAQRNWVRGFAWAGWGAAACLLCLALIQQSNWKPWGHQDSLASQDSASSDSEVMGNSANLGNTSIGSTTSIGNTVRIANTNAPELALAWVHARTTVSLDEALVVAEASEVDEGRLDEFGTSAPSWMLAGVAGLGLAVQDME